MSAEKSDMDIFIESRLQRIQEQHAELLLSGVDEQVLSTLIEETRANLIFMISKKTLVGDVKEVPMLWKTAAEIKTYLDEQNEGGKKRGRGILDSVSPDKLRAWGEALLEGLEDD